MLYRDVLWGVPSPFFFLFAVLFFSSSCIDLYSPSDNVNILLETTLKWDWRGTVDPWHDHYILCFKGWWGWTGIIQETTCFLLTNVAGLYHGVSGLFCLFPLVYPALFSGLTLESPVPPPKEFFLSTQHSLKLKWAKLLQNTVIWSKWKFMHLLCLYVGCIIVSDIVF